MSTRSGYHHGNLRLALIDAGVAIARHDGPESVTVREAARRTGVTHTAAYRHFIDRQDLLSAVATHALGALAQAMEGELGKVTTPLDRLRAVGRAYIGFALAEPGLFRVAFTHHPPPGSPLDAARGRTGRDPAELLEAALHDLEAAGVLDPTEHRRVQALAWSAVHGAASLLRDGPLANLDTTAKNEFIDAVLGTIEAVVLQTPRRTGEK